MKSELLIHYGELVSGRRLTARGIASLAPPLLWLLTLLIVPLGLLVYLAFMQRGPDGEIVWSFSLENFRRLAGYGILGWSADNLRILARSVWIGIVTTILSLALAYPVAFFIASRPQRSRYLWLALVVIPICTNLVIRTYAWMLILDQRMPPARLAQFLGLIDGDSALFPSAFAVYIGMLSNSLPFAVLPLYTSVERIDWSIIEAARDLYASRTRTFFHAIVPQTLPGLVTSTILTLIPAIGIFAIPDLLGGSKTMLVGNLIQQQFGPSRDWPFGAAVSLGLMLLTLLGLFILGRFNRAPGNGRSEI